MMGGSGIYEVLGLGNKSCDKCLSAKKVNKTGHERSKLASSVVASWGMSNMWHPPVLVIEAFNDGAT
jgi:hypothetical protein